MPGSEAKIIFHTQAPLISLVTLIITSHPYRFAVHFYMLPWIPYFLTLAQVISAVIFWKDIVLIIYYPLTVSIYECGCYVLFRMKRCFSQIKVWNSNNESSVFSLVCSHCYVTDKWNALSNIFIWRHITSVFRIFWYLKVNYPSVHTTSFVSVTFIAVITHI
jgi:hypothetical protein